MMRRKKKYEWVKWAHELIVREGKVEMYYKGVSDADGDAFMKARDKEKFYREVIGPKYHQNSIYVWFPVKIG